MSGEEGVGRKGVPEQQTPNRGNKYEQPRAHPERTRPSCLVAREHFDRRLVARHLRAIPAGHHSIAVAPSDAAVGGRSGLAVSAHHVHRRRGSYQRGYLSLSRGGGGDGRGRGGPVTRLPCFRVPLGRPPLARRCRLRCWRCRRLTIAHCLCRTCHPSPAPAGVAACSVTTISPNGSHSTELHTTGWRVVHTRGLLGLTHWLAVRSAFRRTRRLRSLAVVGCSHLFPLICYEKGVHNVADDRLLLLEARRGTTDHQQPYLARSRVDPCRLLVRDLTT